MSASVLLLLLSSQAFNPSSLSWTLVVISRKKASFHILISLPLSTFHPNDSKIRCFVASHNLQNFYPFPNHLSLLGLCGFNPSMYFMRKDSFHHPTSRLRILQRILDPSAKFKRLGSQIPKPPFILVIWLCSNWINGFFSRYFSLLPTRTSWWARKFDLILPWCPNILCIERLEKDLFN